MGATKLQCLDYHLAVREQSTSARLAMINEPLASYSNKKRQIQAMHKRHYNYYIKIGNKTNPYSYIKDSTTIYLIISGFLFVVCPSRTIFGKKKVPTCIWKVGSMVTETQS